MTRNFVRSFFCDWLKLNLIYRTQRLNLRRVIVWNEFEKFELHQLFRNFNITTDFQNDIWYEIKNIGFYKNTSTHPLKTNDSSILIQSHRNIIRKKWTYWFYPKKWYVEMSDCYKKKNRDGKRDEGNSMTVLQKW